MVRFCSRKIQSEKSSKRHQFLITFPCVFRFLSLETYKHKEKSSEVDVFSESSGLNFEDEGVL
jgi:hypothetical protein